MIHVAKAEFRDTNHGTDSIYPGQTGQARMALS